MAGSLASINIKFFADLKQFSTQMQSATRSMKKMGREMTAVGKGMTIGITAPILLLGASSIKAASDAEETASKFSVVFRDISAEAQKSADLLRNSYGLSSDASKKLLGDTGDLLTGFGFSQQSALDLSTEVNKLAVDLASFTNFSGGAEGASQALTKALLGERESVKALGIAILEEDVKARVLANTKNGLVFETERQAKAYATLQIAQEQSKNAIGDYARTSDSFANQLKTMKARLSDVSVEFGQIMLPYALKLVEKIKELATSFSNLSPATKKTIIVVAGLAAVIGPLLVALGFMMTTVVPGLIAGFGLLTAPIALLIAGLVAVGVIIYKNWEPIKKTLVDIANYFIDLYNESTLFRLAVQSVILVFKNLWATVKLIFKNIWTVITGVVEMIVNRFKFAGEIIKAALTFDWQALKSSFTNYANNAAGTYEKLTAGIKENFKDAGKEISDNFTSALNGVAGRVKIKLPATAVETKAVEEKVIEVINTPGGGGAGVRKSATNVSTNLSGVDQGFLKIPEKLAIANQGIQTQLESGKVLFTDFQYQANEIINSTAENFAIGFGELIGNIALGNVGIGGVFQLMLGTIADMLVSLGKMAITTGTVVEAIKKALSSLNGFVAIAAGVAAIALGTFIKGKISGLGKSKSNSYADGGIVGGNSFYGDKLMAFLNSGETVLNRDQQKTLYNAIQPAGQNVNVGLNGEFRLNGQDLLLVVDRATTRKNRTS